MTQLRILYVLRASYGVMGTNSSYMVPHVARQRFRVRVLDFEGNAVEQASIVFRDPELDIVTYPRLALNSRLAAIAEQIEEFRPDAVHMFYHAFAAPVPLLLRGALSHRPRWLIDVRTPPLSEDPEHRAREVARNALTIGDWDHVFSHAAESARLLFPANTPITLSPPGVRLPTVDPTDSLPPRPISRLVYIGALSRIRRFDELIGWIGRLRASGAPRFTLDLYGSGNAVEEVQAAIDAQNLGDVVALKGRVDQEALMSVLPTYDAGLCYIPDGPFDGAPALKFLEYAAAGLPIISSATPGMLDNQTDGLAATYFANDPDAFVATMNGFLGSTADPAILAANRAVVRTRDWHSVVARDYFPVYEASHG